MSKTDSVARILALASGNGGGGGTGGTSNYNDLANKPQINGTTLTGNKTLDELGITADNLNVYTKEETTNAINGAVNDKVDTSYVDTQLDLKADKTALGDLSNLVTDDKSSAIAAINEIKEKGVTEEVLTQALAQESSARQKQDSLLEEEIADKLAPANIKAGNGINVEQSGLDVTISSVDLSNYLSKDNTTAYTPTGDYNPATKKYVDDLFNSYIQSINAQLATLTTPDNINPELAELTNVNQLGGE